MLKLSDNTPIFSGWHANMQNFSLLKGTWTTKISPLLVKRGMSASIDELVGCG